jgi:small conductance mechanosensitive channel
MKQWLINLGTSVVNRLLPFLFIMIAGILIIKIIMKIINKALSKSKMEKAAHSLIKSLVRTVLGLLLGLMAAASLGIDVTGIIALASVLTLAISLSVQDLLTNVIGGFTLLYTKPFGSGDYVEIAGEAGTVNEIGMTYTKLITPDNKIIFIPNKAVVSADIVNYSDTGTRRVELKINVSYETPSEKVFAALLDTAKVPGVMEDPAPFVALASFQDSTVEYTLRVWTKTEDYWTVAFAMNERVRECFDEHGVTMTYPHLNVHVNK